MHSRAHLRRLSNVWIKDPIYFVTVCTEERRPILNNPASVAELRRAFDAARDLHRWWVGRYVIMPDHVHFFCRPQSDAKRLGEFLRDWKRWTARCILAAHGRTPPLWQAEFFDHVLRSADSYSEKWEYVRMNPVRAGLVRRAEEWPYGGEIHSLAY